MIRSLYTAGSGMDTQQFRIDVIANNLANVNTTAFKKSRPEFQDLYYQQIRSATAGDGGRTTGQTAPLEVGQGVRAVSTQKMFQVGEMVATNNPLDMAIEGQGFFRVRLPDGTNALTRNGQLKTNAEGMMVTSDGLPLEPPIYLPPGTNHLVVAGDGTISAVTPGDVDPIEVGRLELAQVVNPAGLTSMGRSMYQWTSAAGQISYGRPNDPGFGRVVQGTLETSNVQVVEEMINLIGAQRAYEINSRVVKAADEMLREAAQVR